MDEIERSQVDLDYFCLKWSNYQSHVLGVLVELLHAESMVDVTLCASGGEKHFAHKIVLCAASPFFEEIFMSADDNHPIVIFSDVEARVLENILQFVYHGELNVHSSLLNEVLKVADSLKIRGLTEVSSQLPLLVSLDDEEVPSSQQNATIPVPEENEILTPVQIITNNGVIEGLYCCETDTPTIKNSEVSEHTESSSFHEDSSCQGDNNKEVSNHVHEQLSLSGTLKENVNQNEKWAIESTSKRNKKRRESCRKEYSDDQLAAALRDLKDGHLLRETATAHNIPRSTLYVRAKADGVPIRVSRQEHSGDHVNAAVEAVLGGASLQQAAKMYDIPKTVLWRRVRATGLNGRTTAKVSSYSPLHRQAAVQALQNGHSLSKVAAQFQVPKTTLFRDQKRLIKAGKLPWTSSKKQSRLNDAVAACKEGRMTQTQAAVTYEVPKTSIWRKLNKRVEKNSSEDGGTIEISSASIEVGSSAPAQQEFAFIEGSGQLPVTYIVEEDFSATSLII